MSSWPWWVISFQPLSSSAAGAVAGHGLSLYLGADAADWIGGAREAGCGETSLSARAVMDDRRLPVAGLSLHLCATMHHDVDVLSLAPCRCRWARSQMSSWAAPAAAGGASLIARVSSRELSKSESFPAAGRAPQSRRWHAVPTSLLPARPRCSNFAGLSFPFLREKMAGRMVRPQATRLLARLCTGLARCARCVPWHLFWHGCRSPRLLCRP